MVKTKIRYFNLRFTVLPGQRLLTNAKLALGQLFFKIFEEEERERKRKKKSKNFSVEKKIEQFFNNIFLFSK